MKKLILLAIYSILLTGVSSCVKIDDEFPGGEITSLNSMALLGQRLEYTFPVETSHRKPQASFLCHQEKSDKSCDHSIEWNDDRSSVTFSFNTIDTLMNVVLRIWNCDNPHQYNIKIRRHAFTTVNATVLTDGKAQRMTIPFGNTLTAEEGSALLEEYEAECRTSEDWITNVSVDSKTGVITLEILENTGFESRTAILSLKEKNNRLSPAEICLEQQPDNSPKEGCVHFECLNFREAVVKAGYDTDADNQISLEEALQIDSLDLRYKGITSMKGVEYMSNLRKIDFRNNFVNDSTYVDFSAPHHMLTHVDCDPGLMVDFTGCPVIVWLDNTPSLKMHRQYIRQVILTLSDSDSYDYEPEIVEDMYTSKDYSLDGTMAVLQRHTRGEGILIEFHMNGFTDVDHNAGIVDKVLHKVTEQLFAIEPFKTFRDCFDIHAYKYVFKTRETKEEIGSHFFISDEKKIGYIICNEEAARSGTIGTGAIYSNINERTIAHEIAHNLAVICDEYKLYEWSYIPDGKDKDGMITRHEGNGKLWYAPNVSYTDDPRKVPWSRFLEHESYKDNLGIHEGALWYYGIYRPTNCECLMNANPRVNYFCPVCRYGLFKTIMRYSKIMGQIGNDKDNLYSKTEEDMLWEAFLKYDKINL